MANIIFELIKTITSRQIIVLVIFFFLKNDIKNLISKISKINSNIIGLEMKQKDVNGNDIAKPIDNSDQKEESINHTKEELLEWGKINYFNYYNLFLVETSKKVLEVADKNGGILDSQIIELCNEINDSINQFRIIKNILLNSGLMTDSLEGFFDDKKYIITERGEEFLKFIGRKQ